MASSHEMVFFEDPAAYCQPPGEFEVIYLLRRDIKSCMDGRILWPGAMAIMAGVDLLGKFLAGDDKVGGVGNRFRAFVERYFNLAAGDEAGARCCGVSRSPVRTVESHSRIGVLRDRIARSHHRLNFGLSLADREL